MALRSLVGKLKALPRPRQVPGFGTFAAEVPKDNPGSKSSEKLADPTKSVPIKEKMKKKLGEPLNEKEEAKLFKALAHLGVGIMGLTYQAAGPV